jgi:FAD/FMN-containing dehydrogenase
VGLSLGGGHGRLEGLHGLVADGIVHFNLVLANGNEIGVNATSNADLFWALKGAGHNFGVVTSYRAKIYPKSTQTWHYHSYVWTGDKLEAVFEALNDLHTKDNGTAPVLMSFETGIIAIDLSISDTEVSHKEFCPP